MEAFLLEGDKMKEIVSELLTYFIIYSFLGWIMESIFRSIIEKKVINTGFLIGPICPIYGFGACIMFLFLGNLKNNTILLFLISFTVLTLWEYIVGVLLEKIFNTKYWDYSDHKFNFQGRICLTNSIYWGILGILFIKFIHPFVQNILGKIDIKLLNFIIIIATITFIVDIIVSIIKVKNIKVNLQKVEKLNKEIKEKLKEVKLKAKETNQDVEKLEVIENLQKLVEKLKKQRNKTIIRLYKNVYRLKRAFPAIDTKEFREILNKKIEINKLKNLKKSRKTKKVQNTLEKH